MTKSKHKCDKPTQVCLPYMHNLNMKEFNIKATQVIGQKRLNQMLDRYFRMWGEA